MQTVLHAICEKHFPGEGLPHGMSCPATGKFNVTQFFALGERDLVFRMAPPEDAGFLFYEVGMMKQEPDVHRLVRERTSIPIPEILVYDEDCDAAPRPCLVMERLSGNPMTAVSVDNNVVFRQVGGFLRELHSIIGTAYGYTGAHYPMEPMAGWVDAFEEMWRRMVDDIIDCGGYAKKEADLMLRLFERDREVFDRDIPASLLHMDIWHQNILVDDEGMVTGIIDWDRSLSGDPEIEFAVLDYCGVSTNSFWEGYGMERDTSAEANTRAVYYYLYELQKYIVIRTLRGNDPFQGKRYTVEALRIAREIS